MEVEHEVFFHAGLALGWAQILERAVINSLAYYEIMPAQRMNPIPSGEWERKYDSYMEKKYEMPFGWLLNDFKKFASLPPDLEHMLLDSKEKRNYLVHRFFRAYDDSIINPDHSEGAVHKLKEAQSLFLMTEKRLREFMHPMLERYVVTPELVKHLKQQSMERNKS